MWILLLFLAEQQQEYSPWGRPGAGAPVVDDDGNILADFNTRKVSVECPLKLFLSRYISDGDFANAIYPFYPDL